MDKYYLMREESITQFKNLKLGGENMMYTLQDIASGKYDHWGDQEEMACKGICDYLEDNHKTFLQEVSKDRTTTAFLQALYFDWPLHSPSFTFPVVSRNDSIQINPREEFMDPDVHNFKGILLRKRKDLANHMATTLCNFLNDMYRIYGEKE